MHSSQFLPVLGGAGVACKNLALESQGFHTFSCGNWDKLWSSKFFPSKVQTCRETKRGEKIFHYFTHLISLLHLEGRQSSQQQPCMPRNVEDDTYLYPKHPQPSPCRRSSFEKKNSFKGIRSWRHTATLDMGEARRCPRHIDGSK